MGATVVLLTDDLMFGSKVESIIRAAGAEPLMLAEPAAAIEALNAATGPALLVVDLVTDAFDQLSLPPLAAHPVIGYYAHTDDDTRRSAVAAGYAQVVPRSRMMREGDRLLADLLAPPAPESPPE